jgi:hypothetical protein
LITPSLGTRFFRLAVENATHRSGKVNEWDIPITDTFYPAEISKFWDALKDECKAVQESMNATTVHF